jgi:hypothetical protein
MFFLILEFARDDTIVKYGANMFWKKTNPQHKEVAINLYQTCVAKVRIPLKFIRITSIKDEVLGRFEDPVVIFIYDASPL